MQINWTDDMATGHSDIDADHAKIRSMLLRLNDAVGSGQGKTIVTAVLTDIFIFSREHFVREEHLMLGSGYPGYHVHKWAHDGFLKELASLLAHYRTGEIDMTVARTDFLTGWIVDHIRGMDHGLASLPPLPPSGDAASMAR